MIAYLSAPQVLRIHDKLLRCFGGRPGLRDAGALESALARPRATFAGEDLYPALSAKAAALLHSLAANHPFVDGNKRTAVLCAELFLLVNGWEIEASDEALEELTMAVARGELEVEEIAIWLEQRLVELR